MVHFIVGVCATAILWLLATFVRKNNVAVAWWQWALTLLGIAYAVFTAEVIIAFLVESEHRAALVMGVLLGTVAVAWAVLLSRFVFTRARQ